MIHLGDIKNINGAEIPPVDVICFGSPCQDLSVAGARAGLDGERSGLFREAIRVIREMRCATDGRYPTFVVFENVAGIYSSNGGEDWRTALEMLCQLAGGGASVPRFERNGKPERWKRAGLILGDSWSVAYRTFDAQYFGLAQRRVRVCALVDLRAGRAGRILFEPVSAEPQSLPRGAQPRPKAREAAPGSSGEGSS